MKPLLTVKDNTYTGNGKHPLLVILSVLGTDHLISRRAGMSMKF